MHKPGLAALAAAATVAVTFAGTAQAQRSPGAPPAAPGPSSLPPPYRPPEMFSPDERVTEFDKLNEEVKAGPTKSSRPVPISPEDVTPGREVRDSKGVVLGSIERVGKDFAVIVSPLGKIEVEFASLAKNKNGLLINMRKSKFDAIVSGTASRAN